jgi:hypothetical protein
MSDLGENFDGAMFWLIGLLTVIAISLVVYGLTRAVLA